jgi:hypothetical protein
MGWVPLDRLRVDEATSVIKVDTIELSVCLNACSDPLAKDRLQSKAEPNEEETKRQRARADKCLVAESSR